MINKLTYYGQVSSILHNDQYGRRKNKSAIDAVMHLTHDIHNVFVQNKVITAVFLDIKNAFDYISKNQLIKIIKKLKLLKQTII